MYRRPAHQRVERLLASIDARLLREASAFFGGGTAISMQLDEFRESQDVDFLCSNREGYRRVREIVHASGIEGLFREPIPRLREVRADMYGVRTVFLVDGMPMKLEIIQEARIDLDGGDVAGLSVCVLTPENLAAEKLLAVCDRGLDRSTLSRDAIDLAFMGSRWGIPAAAVNKATAAYGETAIHSAWRASFALLQADRAYRDKCFDQLSMADDVRREVEAAIASFASDPLGSARS